MLPKATSVRGWRLVTLSSNRSVRAKGLRKKCQPRLKNLNPLQCQLLTKQQERCYHYTLWPVGDFPLLSVTYGSNYCSGRRQDFAHITCPKVQAGVVKRNFPSDFATFDSQKSRQFMTLFCLIFDTNCRGLFLFEVQSKDEFITIG